MSRTSTAAGGRVFTEHQLVDVALNILIEEWHNSVYGGGFSSNDVRRIVRKHFGVTIKDPNYISAAFSRESQAGRIRRTGRIVRAEQGPAKGRMVTTWIPTS